MLLLVLLGVMLGQLQEEGEGRVGEQIEQEVLLVREDPESEETGNQH